MTDAEKAAVKQSLENMAKSLEALAQKQQSLKDALQEAGLDAQLANNPEALKRAIENVRKALGPIIDELAGDYAGRVKVGKVTGNGLLPLSYASIDGTLVNAGDEVPRGSTVDLFFETD